MPRVWTVSLKSTKYCYSPLVNLYHPCETMPALCKIRFVPEIDDKGRLVLIGPQVKDIPTSPNEQKPGTRRFRISEKSGKNRKITDFLEFTAEEDDQDQFKIQSLQSDK